MKKIIDNFLIRKSLIITFVVMSFLSAKAQRTITGVVMDFTSKEPLVGASIVVKGTTMGTITDLDGKYALNAPNNAIILVFNYVGYTSEERTINSNIINAELKTGTLLEVVVTAYGTAISPNDCRLGYRFVNDRIILNADSTEKFEKAHWERDKGFQFVSKEKELYWIPQADTIIRGKVYKIESRMRVKKLEKTDFPKISSKIEAAVEKIHENGPLNNFARSLGATLEYNLKSCVNIINYSTENFTPRNLEKDKINVLTFGKLLLNNNSSLVFYNPSFSRIIIIADTIIFKNSCSIRLLTEHEQYKESSNLSALSIIARVVIFEGSGFVNYKIEVNNKQVNNLFFCAETIIDNRINKDITYFKYLNFDSAKIKFNNYFNEKKIGYYLGHSFNELDKFYDGIDYCINAWVINNLMKTLSEIKAEAQDSWKRDVLFDKYLYLKEYYHPIDNAQQDSLFNAYKNQIVSLIGT